jgi:hypothetical protein
MTKSLTFFFLVAIYLSSCKPDTTVEKPKCFSGDDMDSITISDYNGQILSWDDADWTNDTAWTSCEEDFLNFPDTLGTFSLYATSFNLWEFPNPTYDVFALACTADSNALVKAVIIDSAKREIFKTNLLLTPPHQIFTLYPASLQLGAKYRMYYKVYGLGRNVIYKGHGDLRVLN